MPKPGSSRNLTFVTNHFYHATRPLSRCYPIIFGKKYCRSSQRAQQEIQEQSLNTEEQCRTKHEYYNNKAPHFLTAGLQIS